MDINQSSLSRYKSNKHHSSRSVSELNKPSALSRSRSVSDSTTQMLKQLDLKEGEMVRGQIIDRRFNEIQILLSPSNQVVTAKLSADVPLSIGQEANFQVTENSTEQLVLKYLPDEASSAADAIIQKALSASGLSNTNHNRAIVTELLNHGMPIDKQTLQSLIKLSYMNREASPLTLVLMYKNNLPMTAENIRQFEAYQNGTHQLLNNIKEITTMITSLFTQQESSSSTGSQFTVTEEGALPTNSNSSADFTTDGIGLTAAKANNQSSENAGNAANNSGVLSNSYDLAQGTMTETSTQQADLNNPLNQMLQINDKLMKILFHTEDNTTSSSQINPLNQSEAATLSSQNLGTVSANSPLQGNTELLSNFMTSKEQAALLDLLGNYQGSDELKSQIENKTVTLKDVLSFIQEKLPRSSEEAARKLLLSPEYHKLLESAFLKKWTITPQKLAKKGTITELYQNLQEDMKEISRLMKLSSTDTEALQLKEPVKNIQENLQFMKDLNEAFSYLQLPVQLRNRQLHSDLYVFTRKKALREKPDQISVLLHLTMENLGPLNIHLSLNQKTIQAKFYMANIEAEQIVTTNMPLLSEALSKKGFALHSEVIASYQKPDFSKDFIEERTMDSDIRRYTFDIRT